MTASLLRPADPNSVKEGNNALEEDYKIGERGAADTLLAGYRQRNLHLYTEKRRRIANSLPRLPSRRMHLGSYEKRVGAAGLEKQEEIIVKNAVVESLPIWKKQGNGYEWGCVVSCPPDIFNQERNDSYEFHARTYALEAKKKRLRPGDVVTLKGVAYAQEVETAKEGRKTVKHFVVSAINVISRAKRMSITIYEQTRGK